MFISSSMILVKVQPENVLDMLQDKSTIEDKFFLSINFFDKEKLSGEIHWSQDYEYGRMEFINFLRINDLFVLFTSAIQNKLFLEKSLKLIYENTSVYMLKVPSNSFLSDVGPIDPSLIVLKNDPFFGLHVQFEVEKTIVRMKLYTNGLITYTMTNKEEVVSKAIKIAVELFERCEL